MANLVPKFLLLVIGTSLVSADQFEVSIDVEGNEIDLSWKFNHSEPIYGFQAKIYDSSKSILYESPILHISQRSMKLQHELDGTSNICIAVFENSTEILEEKCEKIAVKDYKIIIGILAGTIFLIPCMIVLTYVVYKDHKVRHLEEYEKIQPNLGEHKEEISVGEVKTVSSTKDIHSGKTKGTKAFAKDRTKVNKAFVADEDLKHANSASKSEKVEPAVYVINVETEKSSQNNKSNDKSDSLSKTVGKDGEKTETCDTLSSKVRETLETESVAKISNENVITDVELSGTSL